MHTGPADDDKATYKERMLQAFQQLCSAPEGEDPWPALNGGRGQPGPFERGWRGFFDLQHQLMQTGRDKILRHQQGTWSLPTLWNTHEVEECLCELREKCDAKPEVDGTDWDLADAPGNGPAGRTWPWPY